MTFVASQLKIKLFKKSTLLWKPSLKKRVKLGKKSKPPLTPPPLAYFGPLTGFPFFFKCQTYTPIKMEKYFMCLLCIQSVLSIFLNLLRGSDRVRPPPPLIGLFPKFGLFF